MLVTYYYVVIFIGGRRLLSPRFQFIHYHAEYGVAGRRKPLFKRSTKNTHFFDTSCKSLTHSPNLLIFLNLIRILVLYIIFSSFFLKKHNPAKSSKILNVYH